LIYINCYRTATPIFDHMSSLAAWDSNALQHHNVFKNCSHWQEQKC